MLRTGEQRLVRVLPVQVDETTACFGEFTHGRKPTVDVTARPPDRGNDTRQHNLVVADDEAAFDARFFGTVAHHLRIGPAAAQQLQRVDEQRFAGAGFAGDCGEP